MRRKRWRLLTALLLLLLLGGCWDRTEVEDESFVIALGLDLAEGGQLLVSARVALVQPMVLGALQPQVRQLKPVPAGIVISARAATLTQAMYILNGATTRRLELRHLRSILVGESLARAGVDPVMMELWRHPEARETSTMVQVRGTAVELFKVCCPVGEVNLAHLVEGYQLQEKKLHMAPPIRMHQFVTRLAAGSVDPFMPTAAVNPGFKSDLARPSGARGSAVAGTLPRAGGNPYDLVGLAIYRRDRLAGFLNVDETQMLLALRGEMGKAMITFPDPAAPGKSVTMRFHQENKPRYQASLQSNRPRVAVRLLFEGEILAAPGGTDYSRPEARQRLERAAVAETEKTLRRLLGRLRQWGADPVGFGDLFRGQFATFSDWQAYHWHSQVRELQVEPEVKVRIRRYALMTGPDLLGGGE